MFEQNVSRKKLKQIFRLCQFLNNKRFVEIKGTRRLMRQQDALVGGLEAPSMKNHFRAQKTSLNVNIERIQQVVSNH